MCRMHKCRERMDAQERPRVRHSHIPVHQKNAGAQGARKSSNKDKSSYLETIGTLAMFGDVQTFALRVRCHTQADRPIDDLEGQE